MKRVYLAWLLFLPFALFGGSHSEEAKKQTENNPISNFSGIPSGIVANCVNVVTGDFFIHDTDIIVQGYEPLALQRSYCSSDGVRGSLCYGWHLNHYGKLKLDKTDEPELFRGSLADCNGSKALYNEKVPSASKKSLKALIYSMAVKLKSSTKKSAVVSAYIPSTSHGQDIEAIAGREESTIT